MDDDWLVPTLRPTEIAEPESANGVATGVSGLKI